MIITLGEEATVMGEGVVRPTAVRMADSLKPEDAERIRHGKGVVAMPPWTDLGTHSRWPQQEYLESLDTLARMGAGQGFHRLCLHPVYDRGTDWVQTHPEAQISLLGVRIEPLAQATDQLAGEHPAEWDTAANWARAYSDGYLSHITPRALDILLRYSAALDKVLIYKPYLASHERFLHTPETELLGLPNGPQDPLESQVALALTLAGRHGAPVHITGLTTAGQVEALRRARAEGIRATGDVSIYHLRFDVTDLADMAPEHYVLPPLAGTSDRLALLEGALDGTIGAITSQHIAYEAEQKDTDLLSTQPGGATLPHFTRWLAEAAGPRWPEVAYKTLSLAQLLWAPPIPPNENKPTDIRPGARTLAFFDHDTARFLGMGSPLEDGEEVAV